MSNMTQNTCDKINNVLKRKMRAEYTMICIHYLIWGRVVKISNEIAKKNKCKELLRGDL